MSRCSLFEIVVAPGLEVSLRGVRREVCNLFVRSSCCRLLLPVLSLLGAGDQRRSSPSSNSSRSTHAVRHATLPQENTVIIPGPLRSFLRMAGISQQISRDDVLPLLARNAYATGYLNGVPTEYLRLVDRYLHQARELQMLAGSTGTIHVANCAEAEPLLSILGYRARPACGQKDSTLVTADPERAFLTTDSGFPLTALEESLEKGTTFYLRLSLFPRSRALQRKRLAGAQRRQEPGRAIAGGHPAARARQSIASIGRSPIAMPKPGMPRTLARLGADFCPMGRFSISMEPRSAFAAAGWSCPGAAPPNRLERAGGRQPKVARGLCPSSGRIQIMAGWPSILTPCRGSMRPSRHT